MTALQKLGVAFAVVAGGVEIGFAAAVEAPNHPGAALGDISILAGAAAVLAFVGAVAHAQEAGRGTVETEPEMPPAARTPLYDQPPSAAVNAAFINGKTDGYEQGYAEGYTIGYLAAMTPSAARHGAETRVDLAPVADTAVFVAVADERTEPDVSEPWWPPVSETAAAATADEHADLYEHPGGWAVPGWDDDWFATAERQRGRAAA